MTGIEDRLTQALRARTDLVTADQLSPGEPPVAARTGAPWRRPAVYVLVAAACAAAIALPFALVGGDAQEPGPVGPPTTTSSTPAPTGTADPSPSGGTTPPGGTSEAEDGFAPGASPFDDVSNDVLEVGESGPVVRGADASLRLFSVGDIARLEVTRGDGTTSHVDLEPSAMEAAGGDPSPTVHTTFVAARSPLVVVRWGDARGVTRVYDLSDGRFRDVPFSSVLGSNRDEEGGAAWSVVTEDGSFYVLQRAGDEAVDVFRWEVQYDGGRAAYFVLGNAGRPLGRWCADGPEGAGWVTCT